MVASFLLAILHQLKKALDFDVTESVILSVTEEGNSWNTVLKNYQKWQESVHGLYVIMKRLGF